MHAALAFSSVTSNAATSPLSPVLTNSSARGSSVEASRPLIRTVAPACASDLAIAQPRPRDAPVTSATFPESENTRTSPLLLCNPPLDAAVTLDDQTPRHSRQQNRRPGRLPALQIAVSLRRILERIGLINLDPYLSGLDDIEEIRGHGLEVLALCSVGHERRARHVQRSLAGEQIQVEGPDRPRPVAEHHQHAPRLQAVERAHEGIFADRVVHHRHLLPVGDLLHALGEVLPGVDDRVLAAVPLRELRLLVGAHGTDHADAERL